MKNRMIHEIVWFESFDGWYGFPELYIQFAQGKEELEVQMTILKEHSNASKENEPKASIVRR